MTITPNVLLVHQRVAGVLMALLVLVNLYIPRRFHWREETARLSLLNRRTLGQKGTPDRRLLVGALSR